MRATHRIKHSAEEMPLAAWQYDPAAPIPIWVARKWHKLGSRNVLECLQGNRMMRAKPTDWIVCFSGVTFAPFTEVEFNLYFEGTEEGTKGTQVTEGVVA